MTTTTIGRPALANSLLTTIGAAVFALCQRPSGCVSQDVTAAHGVVGKDAADLLRNLYRSGRVKRGEKSEGRHGYRYHADPGETWEQATERARADARARHRASVEESRERMQAAMKGRHTHTVPVTQKVVGGVLITRAATPPDRFEVRQAPGVFRDIRGVPGRSWVESYLGSRA